MYCFIIFVVLLTGVDLWKDYFTYSITQMPGESSDTWFNFTLPSFIINLGLVLFNFDTLPISVNTWTTFGVTVGLILVLFCYILCLFFPNDPEAQFCILCSVMLAGSMRAWGHYYIFLIFPVAAMATRLNAASVRSWIFFVLLVVALNQQSTISSSFLNSHLVLKVLVNYMPLYALMALIAFFAVEIIRSPAYVIDVHEGN